MRNLGDVPVWSVREYNEKPREKNLLRNLDGVNPLRSLGYDTSIKIQKKS